MDTLIYDGSAVKSLGGHKIGGHLVLFTTKQDPDTSLDYFDADTDYDIEDGEVRRGYYNHGFDVKIGNRKIGSGTLVKDKVGMWLEAQLTERDAYVDAIMEMVKEGKLGLSSGALSHLVRREAKNKAGTLNYVTHWPIGEWSLTPTPAEPRTLAMPIKMWVESLPPPDPEPGQTTPENEAALQVKAAFSIATVRQFEDFLRDAGYSRKQATAIATHGYNSLRDAGEPEPITPAPVDTGALIDEAAKQARELRFRQRSYRLEGLLLAVSQ